MEREIRAPASCRPDRGSLRELTVLAISLNFTKSTLLFRLPSHLFSITSRWLSACIPQEHKHPREAAGKARADDMQGRTTCRTRPSSSTSHKRTYSRNAREHDRRTHCKRNRSRSSRFGRSNTRRPRGAQVPRNLRCEGHQAQELVGVHRVHSRVDEQGREARIAATTVWLR